MLKRPGHLRLFNITPRYMLYAMNIYYDTDDQKIHKRMGQSFQTPQSFRSSSLMIPFRGPWSSLPCAQSLEPAI